MITGYGETVSIPARHVAALLRCVVDGSEVAHAQGMFAEDVDQAWHQLAAALAAAQPTPGPVLLPAEPLWWIGYGSQAGLTYEPGDPRLQVAVVAEAAVRGQLRAQANRTVVALMTLMEAEIIAGMAPEGPT